MGKPRCLRRFLVYLVFKAGLYFQANISMQRRTLTDRLGNENTKRVQEIIIGDLSSPLVDRMYVVHARNSLNCTLRCRVIGDELLNQNTSVYITLTGGFCRTELLGVMKKL